MLSQSYSRMPRPMIWLRANLQFPLQRDRRQSDEGSFLNVLASSSRISSKSTALDAKVSVRVRLYIDLVDGALVIIIRLHQGDTRCHFMKPLVVVTLLLIRSFSGSSSANKFRRSGVNLLCTFSSMSTFWYCCCGLSRRQ